MIAGIIFSMFGAGLLWLPYVLEIGPDWVQVGGLVMAGLFGLLGAALFVDWVAHEVVRIRRMNQQATTGINLTYATHFIEALGKLTTTQTKELFDLAILTAHGMPGLPILWRVDFPGGLVAKSVLVDFIDACIEIYDGENSELWPVRDHDRVRFGADAEKELRIITDWFVMQGLANPARGNRAATWCINVHPIDIKRGMGLDV